MQPPAGQTLLEPVPDQSQPPPPRHQRLHQLPHLLLHWEEIQISPQEIFFDKKQTTLEVNRIDCFLLNNSSVSRLELRHLGQVAQDSESPVSITRQTRL